MRTSWEEYFMTMAQATALRSSDPATQVGCIIVDVNNHIVSTGYNGFPKGITETWEDGVGLNNKHLYVVHAETNALLNSENLQRLRGATAYVTLFPCNECAKLLIQAGISKVVYLSDKHSDKLYTLASKRLLEAAGISLVQYNARNFIIVEDR